MSGLYYNPTNLTVFFSSKVGENQTVEQIADYLRWRRNVNVFLEKFHQQNEDDSNVQEEIECCDVVLLFLDDFYEKSDNCRKEAELAKQHGKPILPICLQADFTTDWLANIVGTREILFPLPDENIGEEIYLKIVQLYDETHRQLKQIRFINPPPLHKMRHRSLNFQPKLDAIKTICPKNGLMVVSGDEGVGKTYFMSLLFLQPKNRRFLAEECHAGTIFWLNCYPWQKEAEFDVEKLQKRINQLLAEATKRGVKVKFEEQVRILKEDLQTPPLFLFDDVCHFPMLEFIRGLCQFFPCIAVTKTNFLHEMEEQFQNDVFFLAKPTSEEMADVVTTISPWPRDAIVKLVRETFGLKDISNEKVKEIAVNCQGFPRKAAENAFPNTLIKHVALKPRNSHPIANKSEQSSCQDQIRLIDVPNFGNYFPRPDEETAIQNGLRLLAKEGGFFIVEGMLAIGKTTLISQTFHDPRNAVFLQKDCGLKAVGWLQCSQWQDDSKGEVFIEKIRHLFDKISLKNDENYPSLLNIIEEFAEKPPNPPQILMVLDDVCHVSILERFHNRWPTIPCIVLTQDASSFSKKICSQNLFRLPNLTKDQVLEIFLEEFELKGKLREDQIAELVNQTLGIPLLVCLIGSQLRWLRNSEFVYKSIIEVGKEGEKSWEIRASRLVALAWEVLSIDERSKLTTFLLFQPMEQVEDLLLKALWLFDDIGYVKAICEHWERLSLIARDYSSPCYRVHQIPYEFLLRQTLLEMKKAERANNKVGRTGSIRIDLKLDRPQLDSTLRVKFLPYALMKSARDGDEKAVELLIFKAKALVDCCDLNGGGRTSLVEAASNGHYETTRLLIRAGANVEARDRDGNSALRLAARNGHAKIVELLITEGKAKVKRDDFMAFVEWGLDEVVEVLLSNAEMIGVYIDAEDEQGETALMKAVECGHPKLVEILLEKGANIDLVDEDGKTALTKAADLALDEIIHLFLAYLNKTSVKNDDDGDETSKN